MGNEGDDEVGDDGKKTVHGDGAKGNKDDSITRFSKQK